MAWSADFFNSRFHLMLAKVVAAGIDARQPEKKNRHP
jgi:hypothetical protein